MKAKGKENILKVEYIKKALEFVNKDLSKVSSCNKPIIIRDVNYIMNGPFEPFVFKEDSIDYLWQKTITFQKEWNSFLGFLTVMQFNNCDIVCSIPTRITWHEGDGYIRRKFKTDTFNGGSIFLTIYAKRGYFVKDRMFPLPPGGIHFLDALVDWPIGSLIRCGHCEKIFFNDSKRDMKFCSVSCQRAEAAKRSRERKKAKELRVNDSTER